MRIRMLNDAGIARMEEFLDSFAGNPARSLDFERDIRPILTDPACTEHAPNVVQADADERFSRRFDLAEYLHDRIPALGLSDPTREAGLWAWLALLWFEQLAPSGRSGRDIGERAKWIPVIGSGWRYYRHLVLGPYMLRAAHREAPHRVLSVLYNPPFQPGELYEQLVSTQAIAQSGAAIGVATLLYYDPTKGLRPGAGGSGRGSPRRLRSVLGQFDRTFDLPSMTPESLLELLPREFDRFRRQAAGA